MGKERDSNQALIEKQKNDLLRSLSSLKSQKLVVYTHDMLDQLQYHSTIDIAIINCHNMAEKAFVKVLENESLLSLLFHTDTLSRKEIEAISNELDNKSLKMLALVIDSIEASEQTTIILQSLTEKNIDQVGIIWTEISDSGSEAHELYHINTPEGSHNASNNIIINQGNFDVNVSGNTQEQDDINNYSESPRMCTCEIM